jgi:hypothetical protein
VLESVARIEVARSVFGLIKHPSLLKITRDDNAGARPRRGFRSSAKLRRL